MTTNSLRGRLPLIHVNLLCEVCDTLIFNIIITMCQKLFLVCMESHQRVPHGVPLWNSLTSTYMSRQTRMVVAACTDPGMLLMQERLCNCEQGLRASATDTNIVADIIKHPLQSYSLSVMKSMHTTKYLTWQRCRVAFDCVLIHK